MTPLETLLSRLHGVKCTGPGRYIAFSPARDERTPSLAIRETNEGVLLVHDFGGASIDEVLDPIGLTTSDLFPTKLGGTPPQRKRGMLTAGQALDVLAFESSLVRLAASNLAGGHRLTDDDLERLGVAAARIAALAVEARS